MNDSNKVGLSTDNADFAAMQRVVQGDIAKPWDMQEVADDLATKQAAEEVKRIKAKLKVTTEGFDPELKVQVPHQDGASVSQKFLDFLSDNGAEVNDEILKAFMLPRLRIVYQELNSRNEEGEAEAIQEKWPRLLSYIFKVSQSDEVTQLTNALYKSDTSYFVIKNLSLRKKEFACSFLGLVLINYGYVDFDMLQELPDDFFQFLTLLSSPKKIDECKLSIRDLYSLYEKFGKDAAVDLFNNTISDSEDIQAWLSLSDREVYKRTSEEKGEMAFKGWTGKQIVGLYRADPAKFRALARPVIYRIQGYTGFATEFFSDLYDQNKPEFFALTQNTMALLLNQTSWDVLRELYREKLGVFLHVTSLQAMPLVLAIGFEHCVKLFETNCKAMLDVISLPLWLQIQNRGELFSLICLRSACDEPFLSPKLKCEPSVSAQFWGRVSKLLHTTPHISPPETPRAIS